MVYEFPGKEWMVEWKKLLENNEEFTTVSEGWGDGFNGSFIFQMQPDDRLPASINYFLELENHNFQSIYEVENPEKVDYGFLLISKYENWVNIIETGSSPVEAILTGNFELEGDMSRLQRYHGMISLMFSTASTIDTEFKY